MSVLVVRPVLDDDMISDELATELLSAELESGIARMLLLDDVVGTAKS